MPSGLNFLERAIALSEPEGYVRVFVDQGESMRKLLLSLKKRRNSSGYILRLLSAFAARSSSAVVSSPEKNERLLSKREIELLGLVGSGCSNKEIARQLVISVATVKRHTTNIFHKLDARNRTEAVARARAAGTLVGFHLAIQKQFISGVFLIPIRPGKYDLDGTLVGLTFL